MSRRADFLVACGVVGFGAFLLFAVRGLRPGSIPDPLGAGGLPVAIGVFLIVMGTLLAVRRLPGITDPAKRMVPAEGKVDEVPDEPSSGIRPMAIVAVITASVVLMPTFGYVLMTLVAMTVTLFLMGMRSKVMLITIPVAYVIATWLLFDTFLQVQLPIGTAITPILP